MGRPELPPLRPMLVGVCTVFIVCQRVIAQQPAVRALAVEDVLKTHVFEPSTAIRVSNSGRYVAYTLTNPERVRPRDQRHNFFSASGVPVEMQECEVWVVDTRTGVTKRVSGEDASSWGPTWSPDGRLLAFYSDRAGFAQLWVWNAATDKLRRVSDVVVHINSGLDPARWLPSGNGLVVKITPQGVAVASAFAAVGVPTTRTSGDTGVTAVVYRAGSRERTDAVQDSTNAAAPLSAASLYASDLAVVDLATGSVRRIVQHQPISMYTISPDGENVAYATYQGTGHASMQPHYNLAIASLASKDTRIVARDVAQVFGLNMRWSPDGTRLAYLLSSYPPLFNNPPTSGDCFVVDAKNGNASNVTPGAHPIFDNAFRKPIWSTRGDQIFLFSSNEVWSASPSGGELHRIGALPDRKIRLIVQDGEEGPIWSPDTGRSLYVMTFSDSSRKAGFARIDLASGKSRQLVNEKRFYSSYPTALAAKGGSVYYVSEDAQQSADIWRADNELQVRRAITHVNPQFDSYVFGRQRLVHWQSDDGAPLSGALLLPAGYQPGHSYPMIVNVYGGGFPSDEVYEFGLYPYTIGNLQLLATRGFAILVPDAPLRDGVPMRDLANTVLPGVNRVIDLGIADASRLGVMGASYGGYATLALIAQTTRFKAAVSVSGWSDMFSFYSGLNAEDNDFAIGEAEHGQGRMGGSPWQYRDRYMENSPFYYLDRVQTPVLLVHGSLDTGVPPVLGEQTFVALRRLGKEVTYVDYVGEDHSFFGAANVRDYTGRVISWFDQHLTPTTNQSSAAGKSIGSRPRR